MACSSVTSAISTDPLDVPSQLTEEDAERLQKELQGGFRWLRFHASLEREFVTWLRAAQHRSLVSCMWLAMAMLLILSTVDVVRYHHLQSATEMAVFERGVFLPRAMTVVVLALAIWVVATRRIVRHLVPFILLIIVFYGWQTSYTLHIYGNLGLLRVTGGNLLLVLVVFFPCTLLFYESLFVGLLLWLQMMVTGAWVLKTPQLLAEHWLLAAYMLLTLGLAAVNGYMREYVLREQFLLRQLLDWKASHDPLTGLANRRMFNERMRIAMYQARRNGEPLSLALIDVDHFKAYNDHYGHQAGDMALSRIGRLIQSCARRPLDVVVRLGGEEFAVLTYGEDAASLEARMQLFREALEGEAIPHAVSSTGALLTVSMGVAQLQIGDDGPDALYRRADAMLYAAKAAGRDRIAL